MRTLTAIEVHEVSGGSKASYEAGHKAGEAIVKTAQAVLIVAGLVALAPIIAVTSS